MSECFWNDADQDWNIFDQLWNDIIPCIKQMYGDIILGAPPIEAYAKTVKKDKKLHYKIVKLIMILKGEEITQKKEIYFDNYKVTADDIQLLIEQYHKREDKFTVTIDEVTIR